MAIDTQGVQDFEGGFSALLDLLDNLRTLPAPTKSDGIRGLIKWHDEVRKILSMSPELPDSVALTQFAEDTDRALSEIDGKASAAQGGGTEKANPRDDGLLPMDAGFWAWASANASDGDNKWSYTFAEIEKTSAGYGGWTALTGGRTGTMRNTIEDINAAAGVQGNGVTAANLDTADYTFTIQPLPNSVPVWVREVVVAGAAVEYWFSYENGVDGECD